MTNPVLMAITGEKYVVANVVIVEMFQRTVAVRSVSLFANKYYFYQSALDADYTHTPVVTAQPVRLIDTREENLVTDNSPSCTTIRRLRQFSVEPVFLARAHQTARGVVADEINIVIVPIFISSQTRLEEHSVKGND